MTRARRCLKASIEGVASDANCYLCCYNNLSSVRKAKRIISHEKESSNREDKNKL